MDQVTGRHKKTGKLLRISHLGLALLASTSLAMSLASIAQAQESSVAVSYNIPAGSLASAISSFGVRSGVQILFTSDLVRGKTTGGVSGTMPPEAALSTLLSGTGLLWRYTNANTITLFDPATEDAAAVNDGSTALAPVLVDSADGATGPVNGYVAGTSAVGSKTGTSIMETARTVEVVGREEIEQREATNIVDAVRYSAGVTTGSYGYDPRFDQIYVRGFALTTEGDYKDGLRQIPSSYGTFRTDPYLLERLDILKGPASALYGQSSPGGLIDRVSKRPTTEKIREVATRADSTGRAQLAVDFGGALTDDDVWLYRFVGLGRRGQGDFHVQDDRFLLAPSLTYAPSADTSLTFLTSFQKDQTDGNVAVLNKDGEAYAVRASDPEYDTQDVLQYQLGYEFDHRFNDVFKFSNKSRFGYSNTEAKYLTGSYLVSGGWTTDANNNDYYSRGRYAVGDIMKTAQTDANVTAEFDTGPLSHILLSGLDLQAAWSEYRTGGATASSEYDLYPDNPDYGRSGSAPAYTAGSDTNSLQTGLYLHDQIALFDRWHLNFGLRQDWFSRTKSDHYTGEQEAEQFDKELTYNAGILYESAFGLSPYFSYATSYMPTTNQGVDGKLLDPSMAEQFEVGLKYQPSSFNGFFSIAGYKLTQENVAKYAGIGTYGYYYEAIGEIEGLGVEAQARVNFENGLSILASYTYNDAEITNDRTTSNIGNTPMVTPEHVASLWLDYSFQMPSLQGLQIGGGLRYTGQTYTSNANTTKNDASTLFDTAIRYDFSEKIADLDGMSVALNISNITDDRVTTCNNGYCYMGDGRLVSASLKYRW